MRGRFTNGSTLLQTNSSLWFLQTNKELLLNLLLQVFTHNKWPNTLACKTCQFSTVNILFWIPSLLPLTLPSLSSCMNEWRIKLYKPILQHHNLQPRHTNYHYLPPNSYYSWIFYTEHHSKVNIMTNGHSGKPMWWNQVHNNWSDSCLQNDPAVLVNL